jgi:UDP-N-acetyl-D-galactosamine dehydrogenase
MKLISTKNFQNIQIGIIGLGYVGLPLAVEFGKIYPTTGYDINKNRIDELKSHHDATLECNAEELVSAESLQYTSDLNDLKDCNVYIVTVPTPIDLHKQPDLTPLISASRSIGRVINSGDIVIYESTVYPGATEEVCLPEIEAVSNLKFNRDFFAGYSPERINPGDKVNRLPNIVKVTSGSTPEIAQFVDALYQKIIVAGTHMASSIKVAEAAKVIENTQRDVNIALVNELFQIFSRMNIDTREVIEAASTKWNFMKLMPGLVGGHCISVDPYYLLHKSTHTGFIPDLMRKAREINDSMSEFIAVDFLKDIVKHKIDPSKSRIAILGFTFKENCPDIRNTKVYDLYLSLKALGLSIDVIDGWADRDEVQKIYGIEILEGVGEQIYDAIILTVGHDDLIKSAKVLKDNGALVYDFKSYL